MSTDADITQLLKQASCGEQRAVDVLLPVVYDELRRIAERSLRRERVDHTLQTTALVHEAYLKMVDQREVEWKNRAHFFAIAAQAMRRILVNHAKGVNRIKRGGNRSRIELDDAAAVTPDRDIDLVALDEAMTRLEQFDPRKSKLVELRFFGGMSIEEVAEVLQIAPATAKRDWAFAKAWLLREVTKGDFGPESN
ncbi:MAG: sigma-70 family RNA polymerase sigma factor [Pyrinomonadaceae bacterium]|nr:sigma-70 family RNA polymerase sigma factor [Phycisphaerales bacterium]